MGYELATVLISSFCYDLHIKELPTLSHQPVSMTHCRGQNVRKIIQLTKGETKITNQIVYRGNQNVTKIYKEII